MISLTNPNRKTLKSRVNPFCFPGSWGVKVSIKTSKTNSSGLLDEHMILCICILSVFFFFLTNKSCLRGATAQTFQFTWRGYCRTRSKKPICAPPPFSEVFPTPAVTEKVFQIWELDGNSLLVLVWRETANRLRDLGRDWSRWWYLFLAKTTHFAWWRAPLSLYIR